MDREDTKTQPAFPLRPLPTPLPKPSLDPAVETGIEELAKLFSECLTEERLKAILVMFAEGNEITPHNIESLILEHKAGMTGIDRVVTDCLREWAKHH
jgi:hypothetical protein